MQSRATDVYVSPIIVQFFLSTPNTLARLFRRRYTFLLAQLRSSGAHWRGEARPGGETRIETGDERGELALFTAVCAGVRAIVDPLSRGGAECGRPAGCAKASSKLRKPGQLMTTIRTGGTTSPVGLGWVRLG